MKPFLVLVLAWTLTSCANAPAASTATEEAHMTLVVSSSAFAAGQQIPDQYSCKGTGISPPIAWSGAPKETKSLALIMDDPDAPMGTFVHWVIFNVPPDSSGLPEAVPATSRLPDGTLQGANSAGRTGYTGPCPPSGTHRYFFKLYSLDAVLEPASGAGKEQLLKHMQGHILAQGELMGTFKK
jgi:hypothetical protein